MILEPAIQLWLVLKSFLWSPPPVDMILINRSLIWRMDKRGTIVRAMTPLDQASAPKTLKAKPISRDYNNSIVNLDRDSGSPSRYRQPIQKILFNVMKPTRHLPDFVKATKIGCIVNCEKISFNRMNRL